MTFWTCFLSLKKNKKYTHVKKLTFKNYSSRTPTCHNGNVQSHEQEEGKFNSTIIAKSDAQTVIAENIIKNPFNKNNEATIENKKN